MTTQIEKAKQLFNSYYDTVYNRARVKKDKAFKDIVGEEYEKMRKSLYESNGLIAGPGQIAGYNADLIVKDPNTQRIVAIEEDKGHYVDSCFLKRFLVNAAEIINHYIEQGYDETEIPLIFLSSPTTLATYKDSFAKTKKLFKNEISEMMDKKIRYLSYCSHDRIPAKRYFKSKDNSCFAMSDSLITKQVELIQSL